METCIFINLMVRTIIFSLEHIILQKLIANCGTKVLNQLMQLELEKILAISKLYCSFFFFFLNGDQILFSDRYSFVIVFLNAFYIPSESIYKNTLFSSV